MFSPLWKAYDIEKYVELQIPFRASQNPSEIWNI